MAIVALLTLGVGFGIAFWLGSRVGRARGWRPSRVRLAGVLAGLGGTAISCAVVAASFFESSWSPPPRLEIVVPPGYVRPWTILLEDPRAPVTLDWRGSSLPFAQRHARLALPASGVIRLRGFGEAGGRGDLEIVWSDGAPHNGAAGGPGPAGTGATAYMILGRPVADGTLPEAPSGDALAAEIAAREGR